MNIHRKVWIVFVMAWVGCCQCMATTDVVDLFVKAPRSVLPLLEPSVRLDMIDYFRSGMSTPSANVMGGQARVTSLSDHVLTIEISEASALQMVLLPVDTKRQVICCIFTLKTPQPDSWIEFYSTDWSRLGTEKYFKEPSVSDWLTKEGRRHVDRVKDLFPFVLASYVCTYPDNSTSCTLLVRNEMSSYFDQEQYNEVNSWFCPALTYIWTGKMFKRK